MALTSLSLIGLQYVLVIDRPAVCALCAHMKPVESHLPSNCLHVAGTDKSVL